VSENKDRYSHLDADLHENFVQSASTFLDLVHFLLVKFLVKDGIDSVLTDDDRQTQKHLVLYTVIALNNATDDVSFLPSLDLDRLNKQCSRKQTRLCYYHANATTD